MSEQISRSRKVRELVGHSARFDFGQVAAQLARLDLPALRPFLHAMLALNRRKVRDDMDVLSFKTPEEWLSDPWRAGASWRWTSGPAPVSGPDPAPGGRLRACLSISLSLSFRDRYSFKAFTAA
jgi:hypothetical protein